jgi:hypothetical protein
VAPALLGSITTVDQPHVLIASIIVGRAQMRQRAKSAMLISQCPQRSSRVCAEVPKVVVYAQFAPAASTYSMVCAMTVVTTARGAPHRSLSASNALIQVSSWSTGFASALLHPAMLTMLLRMASVLHWSIVATVLTTMAITTA